MFNNEKDFMKAMLDGKKFTYLKKNYTLWYDNIDGFLLDSEDAPRPVSPEELRNWCDKVTEVVEPKWYDDIPKQGVLCWVWDNGMNKHKRSSAIKIIHSRTSYLGEKYFYDAVGGAWDCAKPLTQKEVMQFIYKE